MSRRWNVAASSPQKSHPPGALQRRRHSDEENYVFRQLLMVIEIAAQKCLNLSDHSYAITTSIRDFFSYTGT
jgi:hypothetical protein